MRGRRRDAVVGAAGPLDRRLDVVAGIADERVVARAAEQAVVTAARAGFQAVGRVAEDRVVAVAAVQPVVAADALDDVGI